MGTIKKLDDTLSNMIAAGEVVENMASVIKELVENSLDAHAKTIDITLEESGMQRMQVSDDGIGMDKEDLKMAFERHATSKITTHHDLHHIGSLGFRGEALASIASVAKVTIMSSTDRSPSSTLTIHAGEVISEGTGPAKKGTHIDVTNLFYNTPARLKHLRSESRELSLVMDVVNKLALAHPEVAFSLRNNQRLLFKSPGTGELLKVLHQIYPLDVLKAMRPFDEKNQYFRIKGYVALPVHMRSTNQHITLITNQRTIQNKRLKQVVRDAFGTTLFTGKYPIVCLTIDVDPILIDVNVHPQKTEVKFSEQSTLEGLIHSTIAKTIKQETLIPEGKSEKSQPNRNRSFDFQTDTLKTKETASAYDTPSTQPSCERDQQISSANPQKPKETQKIHEENQAAETKRFPALDYIGQYRGTYLLFQNDEGLYIMDQHAAAERVRYEQYYEKMQTSTVHSQQLLSPLEINLSNDEHAAFSDYKPVLEKFGLTLTLHNNKVHISEIPSWFRKNMEQTYTETMVRTVLNDQHPDIGRVIDQLAKDLACKHSIRANKYINVAEVNQLVRDLSKTAQPFNCPHGRPTLINISVRELETMFKRVGG